MHTKKNNDGKVLTLMAPKLGTQKTWVFIVLEVGTITLAMKYIVFDKQGDDGSKRSR